MKTSQNQQIAAHLEKGKSITPAQAYTKFGCLRLAARISNLKEDGFSIKTVMVRKNGKRFAQYSKA